MCHLHLNPTVLCQGKKTSSSRRSLNDFAKKRFIKHWHQVSPVFSADYEPDDTHGHVDPAHHPVEREQRVVDDAEVAVIT